MSSRVLVTGGSGFIGRWLLLALSQRQIPTTVLMRNMDQWPALLDHVARHGGDISLLQAQQGDLTSPTLGLLGADLENLGKIDVIYHLGASFAWNLEEKRARSTNVNGTEEVIRVAAALGARLVQVSGYMAANTDYLHHLGIHPLNPHDSNWDAIYHRVGNYEASKLEAHFRAIHLAGKLNVPLTVVHPATVCGHSRLGEMGIGQPFYELLHNLYKGKTPLVPGSKAHWLPLVCVDFLAELLASLAFRSDTVGKTLLALDENTPDFMSLLQKAAIHMHVPAPRHHIPIRLLQAILRFPGMESLLQIRSESLNFLQTHRFDMKITQQYVQSAGLVWPDINQAISRTVDWMVSNLKKPLPR